MLPIGLGTFPFSNVFGRVTEEEASRIVHEYLGAGGTYIQTAPYYEGVDALVGRILRHVPRDSYYFATLCVKDRTSAIAAGRQAIYAQANDSLKTTGMDYIDLFMTSTPAGSDAPFAETIEAMNELRQQGKVREIGVCNVTTAELQEYNASGKVKYVQNRFSLIDQDQDRAVREYCAQSGISLVPYNVIEWGLLTRKILEPFKLRDGDLRTGVLPVFAAERVETLRQWVRSELVPIADELGVGIEALSVYWVTRQPAVKVCPVGATSLTQIRHSLEALRIPDDPAVVHRIDTAYDVLVATIRERYQQSVNEYLRNSFGRW